jgi:AcrR family transcriptional regulator
MNSSRPARDRLLAVARDLFTKRGRDGVSVRDITSRAKANLGAITYHFGSKEALYHTALETLADPLVDAIAHAAQGPGRALDRVEAIVRAFLDHVAQNPGAPAVVLRELASDRPFPPPLARAMKRNLGTLVGTITAGQRDGSIRAGDPVLLAISVVAQPFFFAVAGRFIQEGIGLDLGDPKIRPRVVDHLAESVRRSIANHPKAKR